MPEPYDDAAVERGARALYDDWLRRATYFRAFEELREVFENDARLVLSAASRETEETK